MAFFGLTALGLQNTFRPNLSDTFNLHVFEEDAFKDAFFKCDVSEAETITAQQVPGLLENLYRGAPPEYEVRVLGERFGDSEKITFDEFMEVVRQFQQQEEEKSAAGGGVIATEHRSGLEFRSQLHKHTRLNQDPTGKYTTPITTSQENGWLRAEPEGRLPKKSCEETRYADSMVKAGVYF